MSGHRCWTSWRHSSTTATHTRRTMNHLLAFTQVVPSNNHDAKWGLRRGCRGHNLALRVSISTGPPDSTTAAGRGTSPTSPCFPPGCCFATTSLTSFTRASSEEKVEIAGGQGTLVRGAIKGPMDRRPTRIRGQQRRTTTRKVNVLLVEASAGTRQEIGMGMGVGSGEWGGGG